MMMMMMMMMMMNIATCHAVRVVKSKVLSEDSGDDYFIGY